MQGRQAPVLYQKQAVIDKLSHKAYFSVQLMLICAVVIDNLCSCNCPQFTIDCHWRSNYRGV